MTGTFYIESLWTIQLVTNPQRVVNVKKKPSPIQYTYQKYPYKEFPPPRKKANKLYISLGFIAFAYSLFALSAFLQQFSSVLHKDPELHLRSRFFI